MLLTNHNIPELALASSLLCHTDKAAYHPSMQVHLSHPTRSIEIKGPKRAKELLRDLNLIAEAHLVIRGDELVTEDEMLSDTDQIEVRPVISGGSSEIP